jgi:hypothetical protein
MGLARHPETDARVAGGDLDIPIGLGDQHPDRVEGAVGEEHPEQRHPRHEPRGGEAGGDPDHVLLGDTHPQEALGVCLGEQLRLRTGGEAASRTSMRGSPAPSCTFPGNLHQPPMDVTPRR